MARIYNFLIILTSLVGYLEWGGGNSTFLVQAEFDVISKLISDPKSAAHPFTLLPLFGQILLMITLFQKKPSMWFTYIGIACIGLLLGFMLFIGVLGLSYKIVLAALPFVVVSVLTIRYNLRLLKQEN